MLNNTIKDYMQGLDKDTLKKCLRARDIAIDYEKATVCQDTLLSDSAFVYDIGMHYIAKTIANKTEPLTKVEKEVINLHSYIGYRLLKEMEAEEDICQMVLYHHSLKPVVYGEVPMCNELVAKRRKKLFCIDAFIGLTSDRPYRERFSNEEAYNILLQTSNCDENIMDFFKERYI